MAKLFVILGLISGGALTLWSYAQWWNRDERDPRKRWLQPLVVCMLLLIAAAAVLVWSRD